MPRLNFHHGFSPIEKDITHYYDDGTVSIKLTALKVAARAMGIAQNASPLVDPVRIDIAAQMVWDILLDLQK